MIVVSPGGTVCEVDAELGSRLVDGGWSVVGESDAAPQPVTQLDEVEVIPADADADAELEPEVLSRPAKSASRGAWARYVTAQGVQVAGKTRAEIIDLIGE